MELKSCSKYPWLLTDFQGNIYNKTTKRVYKPYLDQYGYYRVSTTYQGSKVRVLAHRATALCWIPNPENKPQVNHKNGIKTDNRVENLEWCTGHENQRHALKTGLRKIRVGEEASSAQHTEDEISKVCELLEQGLRNCDIEKRTGVSRSKIKDIRSGRSWTHISENYSFSDKSRKRKLSDSTINWICSQLQKGKPVKKILQEANNQNISESVIYHIKNRVTATEISDNYHW